jgi:DTW domain-containing protein YfiP
MYVGLCICEATPRLDLATRVVIFMHQTEYRLITNTGVLANRILQNSKIVFRGHPSRNVVDRRDFFKDACETNAAILYPAGEAVELNESFLKSQKGPLTLICPDGKWAQAKKVLRREPSLKRLPCVKLPEGQMTNYRLRRNPVLGRVCTFEAISRALGALEGEVVQETMQSIFEKMVTRILWTRGKISIDEVIW